MVWFPRRIVKPLAWQERHGTSHRLAVARPSRGRFACARASRSYQCICFSYRQHHRQVQQSFVCPGVLEVLPDASTGEQFSLAFDKFSGRGTSLSFVGIFMMPSQILFVAVAFMLGGSGCAVSARLSAAITKVRLYEIRFHVASDDQRRAPSCE